MEEFNVSELSNEDLIEVYKIICDFLSFLDKEKSDSEKVSEE